MRLAALAVFALLVALVLVPLAGGTTVSPNPAPPNNTPACPSVPLLPGQAGHNGTLVAFLQPGPQTGQNCALLQGGTLVGNQLILGIYSPNPVPNATLEIVVEEFKVRSVTLHTPGPNNTSVSSTVQQPFDVQWSNATIGAAAGQAQELLVTVPEVPSAENLTVAVAGVVLSVTIVTPGAGFPVPVNYPQLLLHDLGFELTVAVAFIVGIGVATAIRLRARHIDRLWPFGMVGALAAAGVYGWFESDYPLSVIPLSASPEAVIALPIVLVAIYLWLALFPTESKIHQVRYPVAEVQKGYPLYDTRGFRVFEGPEGPEYIGPGGAGAFLRLLGFRTLLDDKVLNPTPYRVYYRGFRSVRSDVYATYYAWAELPGEPKAVEAVRPRVWFLPWRSKSRAAIAEYHQKELRGRLEAPTHLGFLLYVSPSRAFVSATGRQGAQLAEAWISGTLVVSKTGLALEKVLVAYSHLRVSLKAQALDYGHKLALALRMAEDFPDSPVALKALEDLATRQEAAFMDESEWLRFLRDRVVEDRPPADSGPSRGGTELVIHEAANPVPPHLRADWRPGGRSPRAAP